MIRLFQCFTTFLSQNDKAVNCSEVRNVPSFQLTFHDHRFNMIVSGRFR
jgi:hypothetical protein